MEAAATNDAWCATSIAEEALRAELVVLEVGVKNLSMVAPPGGPLLLDVTPPAAAAAVAGRCTGLVRSATVTCTRATRVALSPTCFTEAM